MLAQMRHQCNEASLGVFHANLQVDEEDLF